MAQHRPLPPSSIDRAEKHLHDVLTLAIEHRTDASAIVVWDGRSELARALLEAYRRCLPGATFLAFDEVAPHAILAAFERLAPRDLVVLIQSTSFRLDAYRIRLELFKRSLKVIEHPHLARMIGDGAEIYIEALAYDLDYYRGIGGALKRRIDRARTATVDGGWDRLVFSRGLEPAKLNVGDYRNMKNIGGQFPIGEVFTESRELEAVNGRVRIAFFGDSSFEVARPPRPITLVVERGCIAQVFDSTPEFDRVLAGIRADEGRVHVRELGFGLNRALTADRVVNDVGTFERMCGVHLSLGDKHASYAKPDIDRERARHHVDVFAVTESVLLDDEVVFHDGAWRVDAGAVGAAEGT